MTRPTERSLWVIFLILACVFAWINGFYVGVGFQQEREKMMQGAQ